MTFMETVRTLLRPTEATGCHWCGNPEAPIAPSGSYRYCSVECQVADADDQADSF